MRTTLRMLIMIAIPYFLFTIDKNVEEEGLDQMKIFTSLVIIIDLDNILANTAGI